MEKMPIIRTKPIQGIFDSDWDGVPNDQDCVWWDSSRQGYKSHTLSSILWRRQLKKEKHALKRKKKYKKMPSTIFQRKFESYRMPGVDEAMFRHW